MGGRLEEKMDKKHAAKAEKTAKMQKILKQDIEIATASPEGLNLMKWIFDLSGYSKILIAGNPKVGLDVKDGTLYNNARRAIWLEIRQLVPTRTLKKIEFEKLNLSVEDL